MIGLFELLLIVGGLLLLGMLGFGLFMLLVQLGVIVKKAGEPPYQDMSDYSLQQGREIGKDE